MCRPTTLATAGLLLWTCAAAAGPDPARGQRLVAQYHCGRCHSVPGVPGAGGRVAVTLAGIGARSYIAGRVPNDDLRLERFLVAPDSVVPGSTMPALGVTPADARDIAAYLRGLR